MKWERPIVRRQKFTFWLICLFPSSSTHIFWIQSSCISIEAKLSSMLYKILKKGKKLDHSLGYEYFCAHSTYEQRFLSVQKPNTSRTLFFSPFRLSTTHFDTFLFVAKWKATSFGILYGHFAEDVRQLVWVWIRKIDPSISTTQADGLKSTVNN